jgi:dUTP pyrophosphatase
VNQCEVNDTCQHSKQCPNYFVCLDWEPAPSTPIKYKKLTTTAKMPTYAHDSDAGMDLYADSDVMIWAYHRKIISTGIAMEIPVGYYGQIRPRSGLAVKHGITAISSGVIDSGYRGEIKVLLQNHGTQRYQISAGDRVAQLLILPVLHAVLEEVNELSETERQAGGHGSTGK